jgi:hypothetical protein
MAIELRLIEDTLPAGAQAGPLPALPRAVYVVAGEVEISGRRLSADEGVVGTAELAFAAGVAGATLWRWEVAAADAQAAPLDGRGHVKLAAAIAPGAIAEDHLLRLDSVAFPPGGCAYLHSHRGPGIRCLREGSIRIDTEGTSASYGPGGPWFEAGPEPVFAQADMQVDSRFIRAMVLPRELMGTSSLRYLNEEDKEKPKSQSYRVFDETAIELAER